MTIPSELLELEEYWLEMASNPIDTVAQWDAVTWFTFRDL